MWTLCAWNCTLSITYDVIAWQSSTKLQVQYQAQGVNNLNMWPGSYLWLESKLSDQSPTYAHRNKLMPLVSQIDEVICDWNCNMHLKLQYACEVSRLLCGRGADFTTEYITGYVTVISTIPHLVSLDALWLFATRVASPCWCWRGEGGKGWNERDEMKEMKWKRWSER